MCTGMFLLGCHWEPCYVCITMRLCFKTSLVQCHWLLLSSWLIYTTFRMKKDESIWYLISTWPYTVLNFNELEMPLESHMGFFTRIKQDKSPPLSESIIRGLFYRSRMKCRLKMVILPKDVSEGQLLISVQLYVFIFEHFIDKIVWILHVYHSVSWAYQFIMCVFSVMKSLLSY